MNKEIKIEGCQERGKTDQEWEEVSRRANINSSSGSSSGQVQQLWVSFENSWEFFFGISLSLPNIHFPAKTAEFRQYGRYGRYFFRYETRELSIPMHWPVWYIPAVLASTVQNWLPWKKHSNFHRVYKFSNWVFVSLMTIGTIFCPLSICLLDPKNLKNINFSLRGHGNI